MEQNTNQAGASKEENAVVLDFLQHGYPADKRPMHMKTPIVQALGKTRFVLLELVPKKEIFLQPHEEVYIGEGKREKIHHIIGKLSINRLTSTARAELEFVIKDLIHKHINDFVNFFNKAGPLTTRMHQLELLPGLGKKHMWEVLEQRKIEPFKDIEDLKKRVTLMPDPEKLITKRIMKELEGNEKHNLFID